MGHTGTGPHGSSNDGNIIPLYNKIDIRQETYKDYPRCEICNVGGIASEDCPVCHSKIVEWYRKKLDIFIQEKQIRLDWAKQYLDNQSDRFQDYDYYD